MYKLEDFTIDEILTANSMSKPNGCRLWTGSVNTGGYGQIKYLGRMQLVHRLSYESYYDESADGSVIRHMCDNPRCINPLHLVKGTQLDNMRDKYIKKVLTPDGKYHILRSIKTGHDE